MTLIKEKIFLKNENSSIHKRKTTVKYTYSKLKKQTKHLFFGRCDEKNSSATD